VEKSGKPAVLIVDTGSNHTAISSRFVDVASPSLRDAVSTEKGSGFSGGGVFTKASLKVGPVLWRNPCDRGFMDSIYLRDPNGLNAAVS
jgi:hypothetical protein